MAELVKMQIRIALILLLAGCAAPVPPPRPVPAPEAPPGLPAVPLVDGPLEIRIVHPATGTPRPPTDSVFIYGSVGTGRAELAINGVPVDVAANGAFLGFVAKPSDDTLRLVARAGGRTAESWTAYRSLPPAGLATPVSTVDYPRPLPGRITGVRDTLATGSDVAIGRPTPTGTYRWFLPQGARVQLTGERGDMVRVRLDSGTEAWFPRQAVLREESAIVASHAPLPTAHSSARWTDIRIAAPWVPFRVVAAEQSLDVFLHGSSIEAGVTSIDDPIVLMTEAMPGEDDAGRVRIQTRQPVWGYKAFYDHDGALVIRVRRPPAIDRANPLLGIRIVVDPGHPPGGAVGPTGLQEADANLGISLRLAEQLRYRGAEVLLTRTGSEPVELATRVDQAVDWNADLLLSIHNNAFPEGVNPFRRNGTSTYFFHPFSSRWARLLDEEIVSATRIRDLGALEGNLALVRPTWMPTVLTESLFMPIPEQEAALRNSLFLERLADAHLRGIERFLRERQGGSE